MKIRLNAVGAILVLIGAASLACSPSMVLQGLIGGEPTPLPTRFAIAVNPESTSTIVPDDSSTPVSLPTVDLIPNATPTITATATPAPLPLRTDLPALTLRDWPRPANDNGRCIHFLPNGYYSPRDFEIQIPRMKDLQMRWVLAIYSDENQLKIAAPQFKAAGIIPIWRRFMRANQRYYAWDRDIQILKDNGLPPYFQLYNEPDTVEEWAEGHEINRDQWVSYVVNAAKDIYNAGGYVGLQTLDEEWLRAVLQTVKARKGEALFGRMFFVPHPYGVNHPPNYTEDEVGVLGFRIFADVFQQEIGFVPPFVAGEGGWKYKSAEDNRFPSIDNKLHAQYHVALFRWFLDGKLADGSPLPDYLFAFCPWLLAAGNETAAWYDSFEGERTLTISEIKKIPIFTRKFSWDKK
ncbi:MAG: hypothetical protein HZB51_07450 [Chloroflexi bacterium]|nr:hypothetical protein [Chloroflexota bacterium]